MIELEIDSKQRCQLIDITTLVQAAIPPETKTGICHIFSPHTTAGISVNENADPAVKSDIITKLEQLIPKDESFYRHYEGNSDAHLKAMLTGFSLSVPVRNGSLDLGTWQAIYFCEYDGPRRRQIKLSVTDSTI